MGSDNLIYKEKRPIVFVPGLFGSLGNDIILGTGNMDFGLAKEAYTPLMNVFKALGYEIGKDLFIAFYDWRKENVISAKKYLVPVITKAKEECRNKKVDLVCHSMGGIVARAYIQSSFYNYDVDKLIMIGTPNAGSVKAYYFWSGGVLPYDKIEHNFFYKMLKAGFLFYFKMKLKEKWEIDVLRRIFPVAKELLPSYDYGDYLIYRNKEGFLTNEPISQMKEKNDLLNKLNIQQYNYINKGVNVYQIIGNGIETEDLLFVDKATYKTKKWSSGTPIYPISSLYGDGTVISKSAIFYYSYNFFVDGDHFDILHNSIEILSNILKRQIKYHNVIKEENIFCSIIGNNIFSIEIEVGNTVLEINDNYENDSKVFIWRKLGEGLYWLVIKKDEIDSITINIKPMLGQKSNILVIKSESVKQEKEEGYLSYFIDDLFTLDL